MGVPEVGIRVVKGVDYLRSLMFLGYRLTGYEGLYGTTAHQSAN
ncbi:hypothetical protein [Floridanema flaviceps]